MVPRTVNRESASGTCGLTSMATPMVARSGAFKPASRRSFGKGLAAILTSAVLVGVCIVGTGGTAHARRPAWQETPNTQAPVALSSLPVQAQDVHRRILVGGPFRYDKDGVVFGNRERLLPRQPRGFYREYTVPTPGERDRGARRIVCGGKDERQPETCFYTKDHYQSFQPIDPQH